MNPIKESNQKNKRTRFWIYYPQGVTSNEEASTRSIYATPNRHQQQSKPTLTPWISIPAHNPSRTRIPCLFSNTKTPRSRAHKRVTRISLYLIWSIREGEKKACSRHLCFKIGFFVWEERWYMVGYDEKRMIMWAGNYAESWGIKRRLILFKF